MHRECLQPRTGQESQTQKETQNWPGCASHGDLEGRPWLKQTLLSSSHCHQAYMWTQNTRFSDLSRKSRSRLFKI